jgi:peptide/nickel transport system substrate-binding protein
MKRGESKMRKKNLLKMGMLVLATFLTLTGCNKYNQEAATNKESSTQPGTTTQPVQQGVASPAVNNVEYNFATSQDIPHLDPHGTAANTSFRETYMIYDRLVTYDGTNTDIKPMLAKTWEATPDGKSYTFHLRDDVKFHDGTPLTAEAVKYSFIRAIKVGKSAAGIFSGVADVNSFQVIDDHTIKITLLKPYAPFVQSLGTVYANILNPKLEAQAGDDMGQKFLADHDMGSGAYKLDSWNRGNKMVLTANDTYWGGAPKLKKVNILIVPEASTARLMLEKGEVDQLDDTMLSPDVVKQMDGKNGIVIQKSPGFQIDTISMNTEKAPFNNPLVRQAFAYAVNYDSIINDIYYGNAIRIGGIIPEGMFGYNPDAKKYEYNLNKAKELLTQAGFAKGLEVEMAISENNETRSNIAVLLQAELAKINVKVNIKKMAWPTFLDYVTGGKHQIDLASWTPDFADPDYNLWYFAHSSSKGPGFNLAFYGNKKVDGLLEQGRAIVDTKQRESIYKEVQSIMADEVPYIFIAQVKINVPIKTNVKGFEINPMNTWFVPFNKMTKE